jgi:hypothetical protein
MERIDLGEDQKLSEHLEYIWNNVDLNDPEICLSILGNLDSWIDEIRRLERALEYCYDLEDRYKRAITNLGGKVD